MKIMKKIGIFALVVILLFSLMSVSVFAAGESQDGSSAAQDGKLDMGLKPESFDDRLGYAVQGTVTGILMVFAVLTLLCLILYASKLFFYDIPNRKKEKKIAKKDAKVEAGIAEQKEKSALEEPVSATASAQDDGELVVVITAAVAAMIESSEYKNEFVGGFRVVSFNRSEKTAWNRK